MEKKRRWLFISMCIISGIGVTLLAASLATEYWVVAHPRKRIDRDTEESAKNVTGGDLATKFKGYIHFGLFHGHKSLDHGLGPRQEEIWAINLARDLFNFGLWVSIITFDCVALGFGLVAMATSIVNASMRPVELLTGPTGVYICNALYTVSSLVVIVLTLTLYFTDLRTNVLPAVDRSVFLWTSDRRCDLHFSFYLVVGAALLGAVNVGVATLTGVVTCHGGRDEGARGRAPEGLMMY